MRVVFDANMLGSALLVQGSVARRGGRLAIDSVTRIRVLTPDNK